MNKVVEKIDWKKIFIWLFPVLFLTDNILGFNGYQFTIKGISIRIILFCITVAIFYIYSLLVFIKDKISLLPIKTDKPSLWKILKFRDYMVLFFIFFNALWATVIPLLVRGEMIFSLKDYSTILVLVLYFPFVFLVRTGRLNYKSFEKVLYILLIVLALWHCVMYIGDRIHTGFYKSYYDFIDIISFGTAVRTNVIYGYGIIRIIQTTSVFLLLGVFITLRHLKNGKWWHVITLAVFVFAICVTYTKSIWFGFIAGLVLYLVPLLFIEKTRTCRLRSLVSLALAISMIFVFNYTVFNNSIFERVFNLVRSSESVEEMIHQKEEMQGDDNAVSDDDNTDVDDKIKDAIGTQQANLLRQQQNTALIKKWSQSKLLGFGYGSYTEECIRHTIYPYMYESTLPALVMKIGLIGILGWLVFICSITIVAIVTFWKEKRDNLFYWLGIAISYGLAVQTNPFLFTFAGFSMLLYLLISIPQKDN